MELQGLDSIVEIFCLAGTELSSYRVGGLVFPGRII